MFQTGLRAAAQRLPFLPMRAGLGSDVLVNNPAIRTVTSPYAGPDGEHEELVAVPALHLDVALVHLNRADSTATRRTSARTRTSTTSSAWPPTARSSAASRSSTPPA